MSAFVRNIGECVNSLLSFVNCMRFSLIASAVQTEDSPSEITVRKGRLIEARVMEYPRYRNSAIHNVRMPLKPLHLFIVDCNDDQGSETLRVFAEPTPQNEGLTEGVSVVVMTKNDATNFGSLIHTVSLA